MKATLSKIIGATVLAIGLTATGLPASAQNSTGAGTTGNDATSAAPTQTTTRDNDFNLGWLGLLGLFGLAGLRGRKNHETTVAYREPEVRPGSRI